MSIRLPVLYGCAFVALCAGLFQLGAKPPDLPCDEKDNCRELCPGNLRYDGGLVPAGAVVLDKTPGKSPAEPDVYDTVAPIDSLSPAWSEMFRGWWESMSEWISGDADEDKHGAIDLIPSDLIRVWTGPDGLERVGVDFELVQNDADDTCCPEDKSPCSAKRKDCSPCTAKEDCCSDCNDCSTDCAKGNKCGTGCKASASCCVKVKKCGTGCCAKAKCACDGCKDGCAGKGKCACDDCKDCPVCSGKTKTKCCSDCNGSPCCAQKKKKSSKCGDECIVPCSDKDKCACDGCKDGCAGKGKCACDNCKDCPVCSGKTKAGSKCGADCKKGCCSNGKCKDCPACNKDKKAGKCRDGCKEGCCGKGKCKDCPTCKAKAAKKAAPTMMRIGVNSDAGCAGSITLNERNHDVASLKSDKDKKNGKCCCDRDITFKVKVVKAVIRLVETSTKAQAAKCSPCAKCGKCVGQVVKVCWKDLKESVVESSREQALLKQAKKAEAAGQVEKAAHFYLKLARHTSDPMTFVKCVDHAWFILRKEDYRRAACPIRGCCACVRQVARICWKDLKETGHAMARGEVEAPAKSAEITPATWKAAPCESSPTCPYLQQQAVKKAPPAPQAAMPCTPVDNLRKLEQAEKLCDKAERLMKKGELDAATALYEKARATCPGSRYDHIATEKLREVTAQKLEQQKKHDAGEEQNQTDEVPDDGGQASVPPSCPTMACSEREIKERLNAPVGVDFKNASLEEVIDELRELSGINIVIDRQAMNEEGIDLTTPLTEKLEGVSLKSVLNMMLDKVKLTFAIKNEVLIITTRTQARGKLVTRTYEVADLVIPVKDYVISEKDTPACKKEQTLEDNLIKLLTSTIAPQSWSEMGGAGTIDYFPLGYALVVNQTSDIQEQIAELLNALRRLQDLEVSLELRMLSVPEKLLTSVGLDSCAKQVCLDDIQVFSLMEAAQGDRRTNVMQAPKVTLFNGQAATICIGDALKMSAQGVVAADHRSVRVSLAIDLPKKLKMDQTLPIADGKSALLRISKSKGMCNLVMVTPRIIINEEEEIPLGVTSQGDRRTNVMMAPKLTMSTCPHMKQKAAAAQAPPVAEPAIAETVIENLQKLERARKLMRKAAHLRKTGHEVEARELYESVQQLCPGSRYDGIAAERLSGLTNPPAIGEVEECERCQKTTEEDVAELLEGCQRALADGRYDEACELAEKAQALDPDCVAANALVYKAHLLIQVEEKRHEAAAIRLHKKGQKPEVRSQRSEVKPCTVIMPSPCQQYINGAMSRQVELQPHMPPIDPNIVDALEKVVSDAEKKNARIQEVNDAEESEEVGPRDPADDEYPGCVDQSDLPHGDACALSSLRKLSQGMLDAMRQTICAEADVDSPCRVRCQVQVGGVTCRLVSDGNVSVVSYVIVSEEDEADLRAMQSAHNEDVIKWIEMVSEGCPNLCGDLTTGKLILSCSEATPPSRVTGNKVPSESELLRLIRKEGPRSVR